MVGRVEAVKHPLVQSPAAGQRVAERVVVNVLVVHVVRASALGQGGVLR